MECMFCHRKMISVYINDSYSETKLKRNKKKIGLICPKCSTPKDSTQFFLEVQNKLTKEDHYKENKKGFNRKRPRFHEIEIPICSKIINEKRCNSKRHESKLFSKPYWDETDNKDGTFSYQLNNPYVEFICKKCGTRNTAGLPMPHPLAKKYLQPPEKKKPKKKKLI